MKKFMDENFLLQTETAQELYHNHAAVQIQLLLQTMHYH
jgi:glucuronate isomerase